ncbi:hypothetical protein [Nocardia suismassiliense]|uniref:hypothetical protein n=1 Tax=Nocardia suismassiliense TaxID=2077092 RepID=UPI00131F4341|nr:hypothetical protein [Nocardia suismassiliense]
MTTLANVYYALLGAIFGVLLGILPRWRASLLKWRVSIKVRKRQALTTSGAVNRWLIHYYDRHGLSLFVSEINGNTKYVPVLYDPRLIFTRILDLKMDWPLKVEPQRPIPFRIDHKLLNRRREMGAVLFQSWRKSMHLDRIEFAHPPEISIRPCEYFEIATTLLGLEEETYLCTKWSSRWRRWRRPKAPLRDTHRQTLPLEGHRQPLPLSVGSNTVLVIKIGGDYQVAIQTRAETVITSPNSKAVIPNFGFEPNEFAGGKSSYGIVFYNFVREYLEELFDYEEIIGRSRWAQSPDWFLRLPEARTLLTAVSNRKFTLAYLGTGIECLSGTATIALLAIVEDDNVIEELMQQLTPNYEVAAPSTTQAPVEFISINDSRLAIWHEQGKYQASTDFALALALKYLRQLTP